MVKLRVRLGMKGKLYRIRPASGGIHNVEQVDESKFQDHPSHYVDPEVGNHLEPIDHLDHSAQSTGTADAPVIDVLVAYTSKAASLSGGIDALIDLAITETNTGYTTSGVKR